jgi:hypothetical protein
VPETVVFQKGKLYCVFNVNKEGFVVKNEGIDFEGFVKTARKLKMKTQYMLKWVNGKFIWIKIEEKCQ